VVSRRYPPLEPYARGRLEVGDGQLVYWETCGRPDGKPAVVLHGGPGSGCTPGQRQLFDPARYRIVLFDQRGAGRSTPHVGEPSTRLAHNTTWHLVADMERLRVHLGIDRWLIHGLSWGSTLGLAYAQRHPDRVSELILGPVTMTRRSDVAWLTRDVGRFFPAEWDRFRSGVAPERRDGNLAEAYSELLESPDRAVQDRAARAWCDWEEAIVSLETGGVPNPRYDDAGFRRGFARTVTHYFRHGAWLEEGRLLRDAHRLAGIPGVLIHGRLDLGGPLQAAWELARAWPGCELVVLERSGHTSSDIGDHVVAATDRFADPSTLTRARRGQSGTRI
jgi:proline iminopeptidase